MKEQIERLQEEVKENISSLSQKAIDISDEMATNPEVSGEEYHSSSIMVDFLREAGFEVDYPFMGIDTAYIGKAGDSGPTVALMAEYDALPEIGHACGHCLHGSMSILAAAALRPLVEKLGVRLWIVGTPSEETNGAKVTMAEKGLFDEVDLAMMIHANSNVSFVKYRSLAMDALEFTFKGRSSHAAGAPWEGRNALNGVQLFFHSLDMLRQHILPSIRIHGIITDGGAAPNIVPDSSKAKFYFRAPSRVILNDLMKRVYKCAEGTAMATETEVSWNNVEFSFDEVLQNETAESMMEQIFRELDVPFKGPEESMGSSDVGNVSQRCPALQPELAIMDDYAPHHSIEFEKAIMTEQAHKALITGATILANATIRTWLEPGLVEKIKEDFKTRRSYPA